MATEPPPSGGGGNFFENIIGGAENIANGIGGAVGFWSDPFGSMYKAGREATQGLATDFISAVTGATLPDLSLSAFIDTYRVSFAISFFVAAVVLVFQLLRTARGLQSGRDTFHAIGVYFPGFILGLMFGPLAGTMIIRLIHVGTEAVIAWAYFGSSDQLTAQLSGLLFEDPAKFAGGVYIAWMLAWAMAIGMLFIAILFVVQLVTLYFLGALAPLATVWVLDPERRATAIKFLAFWVGLLFTHPLLFLLLGLAFRLIISPLALWGNDLWKNLVAVIVAILAMFAAALSPIFLMKYVKALSEGQAGTGSSSSQVAPIGARSPSKMPQNSEPARAAPSSPQPAAAQPVRGASAPPGRTLSQAAASAPASSTAKGSGRVVTAGAGGASRAGVKVAGGAATAATMAAQGVKKGAKEAERAADTSVAAPQREAYGKDRL